MPSVTPSSPSGVLTRRERDLRRNPFGTDGRRIGGPHNMRFTVTKQFVERYL